MSKFDAAMDRDDNRQVITSNEAFRLDSTWTFVVGTTGATGAHTLFTNTGTSLVSVFGVCDTNLAGAATIEVGVAGETPGLIAQMADATNLDVGEVWVDAASGFIQAAPSTFIVGDSKDIILTIGSTAVTAGVVDFYCLWRPLSTDANITVTTPA